MTSNFIIKDDDSFEPVSIVKCYYMSDNKRSIIVKLPNGKVICLPKNTVQYFYQNKNQLQEIIVDDWILRKFGLSPPTNTFK